MGTAGRTVEVASMNLCEKIAKAFAGRQIPGKVLDVPPGRGWFDSDEEDALWFEQRDWHDLTWTDWVDHYCGIFFFTPAALAYYLPSVLTLSAQSPDDCLIAAESLLLMLQRALKEWNESHQSVFSCLSRQECEVLKEWVILLRETQQYEIDQIDRALEFVDLLMRYEHSGSSES